VKHKILIVSIVLTVIILGWGAALLFLVPPGQQALRSQASFGEHVVTLLGAKYPQRRFAIEEGGKVLRAGSYRLPMEPLYRDLESHHVEGAEVDRRILAHFNAIFTPQQQPVQTLETPPWSVASAQVVPRLVNPAYGQRLNLVRRDLVPGIQVAYSLGQRGNVLLLVTPDDTKVWNIDEPSLYRQALANLTAMSNHVQTAGPPGPEPGVRGHWLGVAVGDGNDAARILIPAVRRQIAAVVGDPFFVGLPHNGFLVGWSRDFNRGQLYAQQIRSDFAGRPEQNAVSPEVFMATVSDGLRPATAADRAALDAIPQAAPPPPPPPAQTPPAPAQGASRP
jgi:hypothetical protein